jgi:hypothetical protein
MELAQEYRPSHRRSRDHLLLAQRMGLLPIAVVLILFYAHGSRSGPGLWMALGFSVTLQLFLWSGSALPRYPKNRSSLGSRLADSADVWFPYLLILVQGGFVAITALLFWFTIGELGIRSNLLQNILLVIWLVLQPIRRITRIQANQSKAFGDDLLHSLVHYLGWIVLTLFIVVTIQVSMSANRSLTSDSPFAGLFVWIPATLMVIANIVLFVDHVLRKLPRRTRAAPPTDSLS